MLKRTTNGYRKHDGDKRRSKSYEDVTARTADIVQFHSGFCRTLLRLEKDRFGFTAARAELVGPRKRRIRSHILSHTSCVSDLAVKLVLIDAV